MFFDFMQDSEKPASLNITPNFPPLKTNFPPKLTMQSSFSGNFFA